MDDKYQFRASRDLVTPITCALGSYVVGVALAWATRGSETVWNGEQASAAFFTTAGIIATMAGFIATAMVFLGGASGSAIDRFREDLGVRLPIMLGWSVVGLFMASIACTVAGMYSNGWGARAVVLGSIAIAGIVVTVVTLGLTAAFVTAVRPNKRRNV